jgi:hypothetical protein
VRRPADRLAAEQRHPLVAARHLRQVLLRDDVAFLAHARDHLVQVGHLAAADVEDVLAAVPASGFRIAGPSSSRRNSLDASSGCG